MVRINPMLKGHTASLTTCARVKIRSQLYSRDTDLQVRCACLIFATSVVKLPNMVNKTYIFQTFIVPLTIQMWK